MLNRASSRHELAPSHEPWISGSKLWYFRSLILEEKYSLQEECHQYRTKPKLLQVSMLTLGQLALHIRQKASTPIEDGGVQTCNSILKLRLGGLIQSLHTRYTQHGEKIVLRMRLFVIVTIFTLPLLVISALGQYLWTRLVVLSPPW